MAVPPQPPYCLTTMSMSEGSYRRQRRRLRIQLRVWTVIVLLAGTLGGVLARSRVILLTGFGLVTAMTLVLYPVLLRRAGTQASPTRAERMAALDDTLAASALYVGIVCVVGCLVVVVFGLVPSSSLAFRLSAVMGVIGLLALSYALWLRWRRQSSD